MDFGVITALLFNLNDRYTPSLRERRTKGHWVQHGHGTRHKENIQSQQWLWFYISLIMTLYYKTRQILLQNVTTISLKNATKVYTKMRQFFLSQNATVSLQNPIFITKCLGTEAKHCFFYLSFLSQTFTIRRTAGEGRGYFLNSSLPLPLAPQTLRHYWGDYCRELISTRSWQPDLNREAWYIDTWTWMHWLYWMQLYRFVWYF